VIGQHGLFCSLYTTRRGSHYWHTPEAGGRSERAFSTRHGRLPNKLKAYGITKDASGSSWNKDFIRFNNVSNCSKNRTTYVLYNRTNLFVANTSQQFDFQTSADITCCTND